MTPNPPDSVAVLREIVAFLLGEAPLDGRWFGETDNLPLVAGKYPARYWWRTPLRKAVDAALSAQGEAKPVAKIELNAFSMQGLILTEYGRSLNLPDGTKFYLSPGGVGDAVTEEMVDAAEEAYADAIERENEAERLPLMGRMRVALHEAIDAALAARTGKGE